MNTPTHDALIIGGGFYGSLIALKLKELGFTKVAVLEKEHGLLRRASYGNQARVHNGYHYPRNILTALRCRQNFVRFAQEFSDCIDKGFDSYYAIARIGSKINTGQFRRVCSLIGAPLRPAPAAIRNLFEPRLIEEVFLTEEYAFDAVRLASLMERLLHEAGVDVHTGTDVRVLRRSGNLIRAEATHEGREIAFEAGYAVNASYAGINGLLRASGLPAIPLKHELAEIALVEPPDILRGSAITVMCGSYFSFMPFPAKGLYSLSHVRYTPHQSWHDTASETRPDLPNMAMHTRYASMMNDAQRFVPALRESRYRESIWEIKTILPINESNDGRPILLKTHHGMPNLTCVIGSKIDNAFDVLEELEATLRPKASFTHASQNEVVNPL